MLSHEIGIDPQIPSENPNKALARKAVTQQNTADMEPHTSIFRRISLEITRPRPEALTISDALAYLDTIKVEFSDQPDVYDKFLDTLKENQCVPTIYSFLDAGPLCTEPAQPAALGTCSADTPRWSGASIPCCIA